jgi:hypothetical protein
MWFRPTLRIHEGHLRQKPAGLFNIQGTLKIYLHSTKQLVIPLTLASQDASLEPHVRARMLNTLTHTGPQTTH